MAISSYVSEEIPIPVYEGKDFSRADLLFFGIGQIGPSFEARVFLNNPEADETTPLEGASGYAGSFHIFGPARCFGDPGHCDIPEEPRDPFDLRRPNTQVIPVDKLVVATEAIKQVRQAGNEGFTVTVVPVVYESPGVQDGTVDEDVLNFERLALVTYE